MKRSRWKLAAFHLHQSAEASYKTILLVFSGENPHEHYLFMLSEMAAEHDEAVSGVFPMETERERDLFKLLDNAYIGARFIPEFRVRKEDLEYLAHHVKTLLELTGKRCKARIVTSDK